MSLVGNLKKFLKNKLGQENAGAAATLIVIIAISLVFYILFLPPNVREEMLNEGDTDGSGIVSGTKKFFLNEQPGFIEYIPLKDFKHNLQPFTLVKNNDAQELVQENPFLIKKSWFSGTSKNINFDIVNVDDVNSLKLTFAPTERKGRLIIDLNGIEIYNKDVDNSFIEPIELKKSYLKNNNVLTLKVSSPDLRFWDYNQYAIENLIIVGSFSNSDSLEGTQTFFVTKEEKENIDEAKLTFTPICDNSFAGKLRVDINNKNIYHTKPDCQIPVSLDFVTDYLYENDNKIQLSAEDGEYIIDTVSIETEINDAYYPTYYFDLDEDDYSDIIAGKDDVNMTIYMLDNNEFKEAYIYVNNKKAYLDTKDNEEDLMLNNFVQEGTNTVQIRPLKDIEITRFTVALI